MCKQVSNAERMQASTEAESQPSQASWRSCTVRTVCVIGGALGGAATGACAGAALLSHILMGSPSNCVTVGERTASFNQRLVFSLTSPILVLGCITSMASAGALVGNQVANRILNPKKQD